MSKAKEEEKKLTEEQEEEIHSQEGKESAAATTTVVQETENEQAPNTVSTTTEDLSHLPENVRILKEAFPDIDVDVIEAILQIQGNSVDNAFEVLLGMSDPSYMPTPSPPPSQREEQHSAELTPPMPPRPSEDRTNSSNDVGQAPYAYYERQTQSAPNSVEEQLRLDEEFAKKLALDDEMRNERRLMKQQQQKQQQRRESENDDDSLFNLQEELPIIKEKMREAGNAAKKKVMDFYNQIKANTRNNNTSNASDTGTSSSIPTTNAQYRGLPSDDGDDLLTGDISALHLSDYDVYAQTGGRQRNSNNGLGADDNDTIIVNPAANVHTSTSDAQMKADEDFARLLEEDERKEARRSRQSFNDDSPGVPQMPTRKTVVIAPRSPLEFEGDSDYEYIGLNANNNTSNNEKNTTTKNAADTTEEATSVPYVIGDDDDSDSDDLVDIDEDELFDDEEEEEKEVESPKKASTSTVVKDASKPAATTADEVKDGKVNYSETAEFTTSNTNSTTTLTTPVISNK